MKKIQHTRLHQFYYIELPQVEWECSGRVARCKNCGKIIPFSNQKYCRHICWLVYMYRLEIRNKIYKIKNGRKQKN
jgi:hypothetical protein